MYESGVTGLRNENIGAQYSLIDGDVANWRELTSEETGLVSGGWFPTNLQLAKAAVDGAVNAVVDFGQ